METRIRNEESMNNSNCSTSQQHNTSTSDGWRCLQSRENFEDADGELSKINLRNGYGAEEPTTVGEQLFYIFFVCVCVPSSFTDQ